MRFNILLSEAPTTWWKNLFKTDTRFIFSRRNDHLMSGWESNPAPKLKSEIYWFDTLGEGMDCFLTILTLLGQPPKQKPHKTPRTLSQSQTHLDHFRESLRYRKSSIPRPLKINKKPSQHRARHR